MTSPASGQDPLSAASSISAFMDEIITDAHKEYRAGKKAALKTDFNINFDAPNHQRGTITYTFYR